MDVARNIKYILACCVALCLSACNQSGDANQNNAQLADEVTLLRDLQHIREEGKLRALTAYGPTSYFLYRGAPMGFEYELLKRFADHLGVELEIIVSRNIDSLLHELHSGRVDIVAHGLSITSDRLEEVAFTDYLYLTHQVLVQRKPHNWQSMQWRALQGALIHDPIALIGDTVSVRRNSAYFNRLVNLSQEMGGAIVIDTLPGHLSTEDIIQMVADGKLKYTIADNNIAAINTAYNPSLHAELPISFSQRAGWAVRQDATSFLAAANEWIEEMKEGSDYYAIYNNYFKNTQGFRRRVDDAYYSLSQNAISPYDDLLRTHAERIGWDWRLLASVVYQESRFDPESVAWTEASGLMQLMPATALELGVDDVTNPAENLRAGANYLKQIWSYFEGVPDSLERIKFTLASYNCGYGHVRDAQRLAAKNGGDSLQWSSHVAEALRSLSSPEQFNDPVVYYGYVRGMEPYLFVEQIFERYGHYKAFVE